MAKHEGSRSRGRDDDYKKSRSRDDDYKKKDKHWKGKRKHKKHEDNDNDDSGKRKHKHGKGKWKHKKYDDSDSDSDSSDSDSDDDSRRNKRNDKKKNKKKNKKSNDSDSGDGSNQDCDWNIGWIGRKNNDENDDDDNDGNEKDNGGHCCLWKEISQNPFLRQVNVALSHYLANNKKTFWSCSSSSPLDITMADVEQSNTAWQNKVNNTPGAIMLFSDPMGKFIAQALRGYFDPWMDMGILNETYMLVQKDAGAANSQGIGAYSIHSRRPIFPNGPTDLRVKLENKAATVMVMVSPCDVAEFYCKTAVGGEMNFYRKDLKNPIEGFQVVVELDNNYYGVCLSLAMANVERAWDYVYSSFIKLPQ
ncbi:hypothetical protein CEP54_010185 [Fusarium duplospermum]|uniref:Uncharacterized protein n=1 Tax=Fusarium duplospermum TaxID=1325734 RepID=A0A428PLL2_9HYPO|nr:hypothetical protein CEP54_010185 [Fusarium duplospermum]